MRVFLLSAWLGGLRLNEALSLEWDEADKAPFLDLVHNRIVFPAAFVKATEDQWVPLDQDLREAILALPKHGKKVFCFLSKRGRKRILSPSRVADSIGKLAKKAGVRMTMKTLRSGFGCYWAARVSAQVLQKLMRHASITTTMIYYVNVDDAAVEAISSRPRNSLRNSDPATEQKELTE
jgi:integrase